MVSSPVGWCARPSAGRTRPDSHNGAAGTEPEPPASCPLNVGDSPTQIQQGLASPAGFEPTTRRLEGGRSIH